MKCKFVECLSNTLTFELCTLLKYLCLSVICIFGTTNRMQSVIEVLCFKTDCIFYIQ